MTVLCGRKITATLKNGHSFPMSHNQTPHVDHFRIFNEEEGHDAGDKVLKMVTEVLKSCVRPYDLAARYGGEEFTIVMPGVSKEVTIAVAERIRAGIADLEFVSTSGIRRTITASLGCALYPQNASD